MEKGLEIREAVRSDIDSILEIETVCFGADSFSRKQFLYLITQAKGIFYVVTDKGKVIAYSSLISNARTHNLRIYSIAVHPDARGRKLGQLLMEKAIGFARSHQLKKITLEVNVTNEAAISLYLKNGFEPVHIIYNYYANGSNAYYMQKMVQI